MLVDLSAGFVQVTNRLVEDETKSIGRAFRADYDYFAWLIRRGHRAGGSFRRRCWLSSCLLLVSRRACLRKRPSRDQRASESVDCSLYHESLPAFNPDVLPQPSWFGIRRTTARPLPISHFDRPATALFKLLM